MERGLLCLHFDVNLSDWLRPVLFVVCAVPVAGTLLSFSKGSHWIFRVWDFPRVQLAAVAAIGAALYGLAVFDGTLLDIGLVLASAVVVVHQFYRVHVYTPLVRPTVKRATLNDPENRFILLIANVLQENREYGRLLATIERDDPDVVLAVEVDDAWNEALAPVRDRYTHHKLVPLNNTYGMVLFSRLELIDPRVEHLVQDDIPSIHCGMRLPNGVVFQFHGLHPRPPEPVHNQPSSPRDAEIVIVGRAIGKDKGKVPTVVAGDLNDVAWSTTSELFVRLSGLLDPRVGRGFFATFNANMPIFRWALDHVFHSIHFALVRMERLGAIGSDHFPILIELQYDPNAARDQEPSHRKAGDEETADEKLEQEAADAATGADRPESQRRQARVPS
ncbi:MAG: endonuclease/exonuclease/phosphatase family protein [Thermoanaerobaculia bacterium]